MMKKMLEGIRVIDLSRNLAAPYATMILADLGAEVIKVEMPETGDPTRVYAPVIHGKGGYFLSVNRGKRSITLDLKKPQGMEVLEKLITSADIMVDNFRPGVLDRLGLTEQRVSQLNPRLIFSSITGFGQTGPYREKAAYDLVVQGLGGLMSVTGQAGGEPTRVGVSIGDLAAGLYLVIGVLGALYAREQSGKGDRIDIAMLDCQVALLENSIIRYTATGKVPEPIGNRHASITPFEMFPSKNGNFILCVGNEGNWVSLCKTLNLPHLLQDSRFKDNNLRTENRDDLYAILAEVFAARDTEEWLSLLESAGIACGPVNDVAQVVENEQVNARQMIQSVEYPQIGTVRTPGSPVKSREYQVDSKTPAPELGADNEEILLSLGYTVDHMRELVKEHVL